MSNKADGSTRLTTTEQHVEGVKEVAGLDHIPDSDQHRAVDPSATRQPISQNADGLGKGPELISTSDQVEIICGPLLNCELGNNDLGRLHDADMVQTSA